jgi:succinoglycan biosynthesis transport protein ExoP
MRPSAAEALKAAIRRSLPIVVGLVLIGAIAMNAYKQVQGAEYAATAKVYHTNTDLASALTDIQPAFVDPERAIETSLSLARAPEPYIRAARRLDLQAGEVRSMVHVSGSRDADVITFVARSGDEDEAARVVNTVARSYIEWRDDLQGSTIRQAIGQLEAQLRQRPPNRAELADQLDRLRVLATLSSGSAVLIERATGAPKVSPAPLKDTLLGASVGFVLALLISGAREAFNTRIRSEADVQDALGKPVLATIQTLPKRAGLVTVGRHETRWGDTYGLLAANLMQLRGPRDRPTVLAVTSAIAGEGKTTTASNLAVALAQRGQRVVLAEFDIRKPAVGKLFRVPPDSPGIIQVVDGTANLESALWTVQLNGHRPGGMTLVPPAAAELVNGDRRDGGGSLRIIPAGGTERGARIARSPQTHELLQRLAADADVIILDTPPALATVEMAELSGSVDAVLVVVRHGRVTRRSLVTLSRQAEGWRAGIVGAVLTDSPAEEDEYYYYKG